MFPSSATARKYLSILKSMPHTIPYSGISVNYGGHRDIFETLKADILGGKYEDVRPLPSAGDRPSRP